MGKYGTVVKYYYAWKKSRNKKSLMDKSEARELAIINGIFADDSGENDTSDSWLRASYLMECCHK